MLAVVGKCTACKNRLSIIEPGLVCFSCEKYYHGSCTIPPQSLQMLQNTVLLNEGWYCQKCMYKVRKKRITRTDKEMLHIKQKLDTIVDIREVLIELETTFNEIFNKCQELRDDSNHTRMMNEKLKKRLQLHVTNKREVPSDFDEWLKQRKRLEINDREVEPLKIQQSPRIKRSLTQSIRESHIGKPPNIIDEKKPKTKKKAPSLKPRNLKSRREFKLFVSDLKSFATSKSLSNKEKIIYWIHTNLTHGWFIHVLLVLVLIIYTLIGAVIFMTVEGGYENKLVHEIEEERYRLLQKGYGTKELEEYYDFLESYFKISGNLMSRDDGERNWNFVGSIFFCGVTYTTLGYGGMYPLTNLGKILMMIYALFGIPLFLILLTALGNLSARIIKKASRRCCKCFKTKQKNKKKDIEAEPTNSPEEQDVPLFVFFVLEFFYFLIGTIMYMFGESWNFFGSFYFICITMLTLGLGEYMPTERGFMICCIAYVIIGLAITSMGISIIMAKMQKNFDIASNKLGAAVERYVEDNYYTHSRSRDRLN